MDKQSLLKSVPLSLDDRTKEVTAIDFNFGVIAIEVESEYAGQERIQREAYDIVREFADAHQRMQGISEVQFSIFDRTGALYEFSMSFDETLRTINYDLSYEQFVEKFPPTIVR